MDGVEIVGATTKPDIPLICVSEHPNVETCWLINPEFESSSLFQPIAESDSNNEISFSNEDIALALQNLYLEAQSGYQSVVMELKNDIVQDLARIGTFATVNEDEM